MCELSIVVPVYNVEDYLERCLDSILAQTYTNFELICVDDGSTDSSLSILEAYAQRDGRIKIIHKENGGLVSARKAGISLAAGKYAVYVDSDDWIEKDMYEHMMKALIEADADIVSTGIILDYADGSITEMGDFEEGIYSGERLEKDFFPKMINTEEFFEQKISMRLVQKIFRTELLKRNQMQVPDEITVCEDVACSFPCLLEAKSVVVLNKAFYHYCIRENSIMGTGKREIASYKILYKYLTNRLASYKYPFLKRQIDWQTVFAILMVKPSFYWDDNLIFPYKELKPNTKVVLYGMGRFGSLFKEELENAGICKVVGTIDANRRIDNEGRKCYTLDEFVKEEIAYDYILITITKRNLYRKVKNQMEQKGIPSKKILEPDAIDDVVLSVEKFA